MTTHKTTIKRNVHWHNMQQRAARDAAFNGKPALAELIQQIKQHKMTDCFFLGSLAERKRCHDASKTTEEQDIATASEMIVHMNGVLQHGLRYTAKE